MAENKRKRSKWATIVGFFLGSLMAFFANSLLSDPVVEEQKWPSTASVAKTVPLTEIRDLLQEEGNGRRVAIVSQNKIFIEIVQNAGEASSVPEAENLYPTIDLTLSAFLDGRSINENPSNMVTATLPVFHDGFMDQYIIPSSFEVEFFRSPEAGLSFADWFSILFQVLFFALIAIIVLQMMGKGFGNFGTEKGFDLVDVDSLKTGLEGVAGLDSARQEVEEIVTLLKSSDSITSLGGRMPKGLLLDGPPGTGKTLLARSMAKEAGVNFIKVDASSLSQMYVGLGSMKIRRLFRLARKNAPCIIFIDEIDAVGGARGAGGRGSGDQDRENTLNALLTELDGFEQNSKIFVIAATNRPEMLDSALVRPGRIDRKITLHIPDIKAREEILRVHVAGKPLAEDVDLRRIASTAYHMSGAQLANLVNEAALQAGRMGRKEITMSDFNEARDRMLMPQSGGSIKMLEDERWITAVHEAGHAVAAILLQHADPVEKVTIAPRGSALGFVLQSPERDRVFESKARLNARLVVAAAGREAERLFFGNNMVTTGAASDIRQATYVARAMVTTYGMSDLGFMHIDPNDPLLVDMQNPPARMISKIIEKSISDCADLLGSNKDALQRLADTLMEEETISGERAREIVLETKRAAA